MDAMITLHLLITCCDSSSVSCVVSSNVTPFQISSIVPSADLVGVWLSGASKGGGTDLNHHSMCSWRSLSKHMSAVHLVIAQCATKVDLREAHHRLHDFRRNQRFRRREVEL